MPLETVSSNTVILCMGPEGVTLIEQFKIAHDLTVNSQDVLAVRESQIEQRFTRTRLDSGIDLHFESGLFAEDKYDV